MDSLNVRAKVIIEINLIPEDKLEELYNFIHYFRLGVEVSQDSLDETMKFAGCWNDMSDEMFTGVSRGINLRRDNLQG